MEKNYSEIKKYLIDNADAIQKLATKYHKDFLGGKKFRTELIKKYQKSHIEIINQLANHLENSELKKGTIIFKDLAQKIAISSIEDKLYIEEAVDGVAFLKHALWEKLDKAGLINSLSVRQLFNLSQRTGIYIDVVSSELAFTYQRKADELQKHFVAIVESSDDAIIGKNLAGFITSWNKGAERLYGYSPKEIIGQPVSVLMAPEKKDDFPSIMKELQKGRKIEHYETRRMKKNGEIIDVSITVSPIKDNNGKIIGASKIARDITERKKLEQQKDDFISIATHELKTPVTSIKAYAQVLQNIFIKKNDPKSAEYLGKMDAQLNKLTSLIADLLDVNKIQSGQLKFHQEPFYFNGLVKEIVEELQRTTDKHILITKLDGSRTKLIGDKDRIGQVLTNLISNAIKYSPHAKKIIIESSFSSKEATLCVKDFGVGIPKEKQEKVFEKFFRVSGPKQDTFPGMGLGLFISSEIIKRQNGKIWVESALGKGSIFCFSLPLKPSLK